jgi:hypothetical protein
MPKLWLPAGVVMMMAGCINSKPPLAPTAIAEPAPPLPAPPLPTTVPGVLAVAMPIQPGDSANTIFGIAPFGYHGAEHAADGHPGWDIEYRIGGIVRAAAAGTVENVIPDSITAGRFTVQIEHIVGTHHFRTSYTNLASLNADIAARAAVAAGQALGIAGTLNVFRTEPPRGPVSYAMTHFQLDDFEYFRETNNPNAVSPEPFLTASAKSLFDGLWSGAAFLPELVEPFATNPRELRFPASRTWTRAGGDGPAGIRFTRRTATGTDVTYELLAESGTVIEAGTVSVTATARPYPFIDLVSPTAGHIGIYEIVSNEMRLSLTPPGSQRPLDFSDASTYRTK